MIGDNHLSEKKEEKLKRNIFFSFHNITKMYEMGVVEDMKFL